MLYRATSPDTPRSSKKRRGATSIEYAFMVSLILLGCIIGVQQVGSFLKKSITNSAEKIEGK